MDPPVTYRNRTQNWQIATAATKTTVTGSQQPVVVSNPTGVSGTYSLMSDNNHSSYFTSLANGQIVMGDMLLQRNTRDYTQALLNMGPFGTTRFTLKGDFASQVVNAVIIPDNLAGAHSARQDASLISAYAKITADSVMSSETLLGLGKTVNMLRSPFSQGRKHLDEMFKSASRSYGKTADSVTKANASAWLEYRYGMLPTYLDVNQVIKIFGKKYTELERRRHVVRSGSEYRDDKIVAIPRRALPILNNIGLQCYATGSVNCTRFARVSSGVLYEVAPRTEAQELAVQFQLGASAILPSLWEQIPFSFVADWFYNIGDWLAANQIPPDITLKGNWTTVVKDYTDVYTSSDFDSTMNNVVWHGSWGSATKRSWVVSRCCNRTLPTLPVMTARWATVTHALDACSLLLGPIKDLIVKLR